MMTAQDKALFFRTGSIRPGRSVFDLSYQKILTCDMGQLIPIMCDEVVPGDMFEIGNEIVVRFQPMVAPILHEVNAYVHYFFVPYRLMWPSWENFITGGMDGNNADVLPRWSPTNNASGSLWDFLGLPVGVTPLGALPMDFPRRAYNKIYNQYYRDETLIAEVAETNEAILLRAWEKDYFTSSLPWQQRGTAPAFPISGTSHAVFNTVGDHYLYEGIYEANKNIATATAAPATQIKRADGTNFTGNTSIIGHITPGELADNDVNLGLASTFNVKDIRLAFQIQRWMERNARAGARYTEFLKAHYGVAPRDERLQRPEYIGGSKSPVIMSEVLQTSATSITGGSTPQANMAGHAISVDRNYIAKYHAQEFGVIMGILSIMPKPVYGQGINKQWLRTTRYDFYSPEFANLSEQAVIQAELYADGNEAHNTTIFGYQGRFDEMRFKPNMFVSGMRDTYNYWHLGRIFSSAPLLNQSFIECNGPATANKRPFAVQNVPEMIVSFGNKVRAVRPMPIMSQPGMIDHDDRI